MADDDFTEEQLTYLFMREHYHGKGKSSCGCKYPNSPSLAMACARSQGIGLEVDPDYGCGCQCHHPEVDPLVAAASAMVETFDSFPSDLTKITAWLKQMIPVRDRLAAAVEARKRALPDTEKPVYPIDKPNVVK